MDFGMPGNPLDHIQPHDLLSIPCVITGPGEDPGPALRAAGIFDPISFPLVTGDDPHAFGFLGDGITPNLTAVLETRYKEGAKPARQPKRAASQPKAAQPAEPVTTTAAYGSMRSLAPISGLGDRRPGLYGNGPTGFPPSPGQSADLERILSSGYRKIPLYVRFDPYKHTAWRRLAAKGSPDAAGDAATNQGVLEQAPHKAG